MKTNPTVIDHFSSAAPTYDEKNQQLAPIADNMHFLIRLILKKMAPARARVLCVGVGTGAEIFSLANLSKVLREGLTVISPEETEGLLSQSGIQLPIRFFQAFMISGWYGLKSSKK